MHAIDFKNAFLAFSGGKDSVAISKYMLEQNIILPHVAVVNEELDYKENLDYIKNYADKYNLDLYFYWLKNRGLDFVKANPKCTFGEVGAALGKEWNSVKDSAACKKYYAASDKDKLRYEKESKAYYAGLGNC